jgi:hypothetical protein
LAFISLKANPTRSRFLRRKAKIAPTSLNYWTGSRLDGELVLQLKLDHNLPSRPCRANSLTRVKTREVIQPLLVRIVRDRPNRKLWLCQDFYIEKFTNWFNLQPGKMPFTPMTTDPFEKNPGKATPQDIHPFQ